MDPIGRAVILDVSREALHRSWGWLVALGVLQIVLGTIGLGSAFLFTIASVMLFGGLIFIGGVIGIVQAFAARQWSGFFLQLLIGILYVLAGVVTFLDPLAASVIFTLVLGIAILVTGVFRVVLAFQHRDLAGWGWILASAIISILLGLIIIARWPLSGFWVIGLFVAIELLLNGWACLLLGLGARAASRGAGTSPTPGAPGPATAA